ncbi:SDR family oxidoreductase [Candidatus Gottesmanbacteria bacterium]|nr:SDR family oxidoreductase [Candidatus Gottesmanbacteria bacterium]
MPQVLREKTALITGSAKNLGRAIAVNLARQGVTVFINCHKSESASFETLKEVKKYSSGFLVQADVTKKNEINHLFQTIEKEKGGIDILVNLVGNFIFEPITTTTFEKFQDVIESNLYSSFLCCQKALPSMMKKNWGRIINFGCVAADTLTVRKNTTPYYIAKTGVILLTKVLAFEYAKYGITINSISPGILKTSVAKAKTPTGKYAQFEDIINAINFLLKEESGYINGANLEVSGGWRPGLADTVGSGSSS